MSVLKIGMPNPLPEKLIRDFAAKVKKLYVESVLQNIKDYIKNEIHLFRPPTP